MGNDGAKIRVGKLIFFKWRKTELIVRIVKKLTQLLEGVVQDQGTQLVTWCFEPSQPQRITSGLIRYREG